jgi:hypothetical protein
MKKRNLVGDITLKYKTIYADKRSVAAFSPPFSPIAAERDARRQVRSALVSGRLIGRNRR